MVLSQATQPGLSKVELLLRPPAGFAVNDLLIAMQQLGNWGEALNIGGRDDDGVNQHHCEARACF